MSEPASIQNKQVSLVRIGQVIKRLPFTLCMVLLLIGVALLTGSYFQELANQWVTRLGFAPRDFWFFRWERLILSALVTSGGYIFWFATGFVALTSGLVEWKAGSWRAIASFWGVHITTLVFESLLFMLPLHQLGFTAARTIFFSRDVGPSAGYMGSLGFSTPFLPKPWRWVMFGGVMVFLVVSLFIPPRAGETQTVKLSADIAHLLAYPIGIAFTTLFPVKRTR